METQEASVEKKTFTDAEIAANDGVIYLANCGSSDTSVTPSGSKRGLYQGMWIRHMIQMLPQDITGDM